MAIRKLIVTRVSSGRGMFTSHTVMIDGRAVGKIKNGQTLSFPISEGDHTITFDPRSMMIETLGPFAVTVGKSDVNAVLDPGSTKWRCDITGTASDIDLDRDMAGAYAELLREAMNELQRNTKCIVFFHEKGAKIGLHGFTYSYGSLTGYKIRTLQPFEQDDAAESFAYYIHKSGNDARVNVFVGGRGVELTLK